MEAILRLPDVKSLTGLSRSSIYAKMRVGEFPRSISLGCRSVGWLQSEVRQWIDYRIATSRQTVGKE